MAIEKNTAGKWIVFAFNRTNNVPLTGDSLNITANVRIDGAAANGVDDTNPAELEDGYYIFDLTATETDGDLILLTAESTTGDIQVIGVPGAQYTFPPNHNAMGIETDGHVHADLKEFLGAVPDALIAGAVVSNLKAVQANAITAAAIATDAIGSDEFATTAVNEIRDSILSDATTFAGANIDAAITSRLAPTVVGRNVDVTVGGAVGVDWANVENQATAVDLSATDFQTVDTATVAGNMRGTDNAALATALVVAQDDLDIITGDAGALLDSTATSAQLVDDFLDEINTGATHNVNNSVGKQIRQSAAIVFNDGQLQSATASTAVLAVGASAIDNLFRHAKILTIGGTAAGQERVISDYDGGSLTATVTPDWTTNPDNTTDYEIIPASAHASTINGGYEGGAVWLDTGKGTAGTLPFVNGTISRPVNNIADARIIADGQNLRVFHCLPGSSFTLAQAFTDFEFMGQNYVINLGGQDVSGTRILIGQVIGTGEGAGRLVMFDCIIGLTAATTFNLGAAGIRCNFGANTVTLGAATSYSFSHCATSGVIGLDLNFGTAIGDTRVNMPDFSGALVVDAMGDTGADTLFLTGQGSFTEGTCAGGTVDIVGAYTVSGITNINLIEPARFDLAQINAEMVDVIRTDTTGEPAQGAPPATASISEKVDWIFKTFRNKKTQTATDWKLFDDTGIIVDSKAVVSEAGGLATKFEIVSGP